MSIKSKYLDFEMENLWFIWVQIWTPTIIIFLLGVGIGYALDNLLTL